MSDIRAFVQATPGRPADGNATPIRSTPYGDLFNDSAIMGYCVAGRLYGAHFGTVTTPLAAPNAGITAKRPQAWLRVPDGTTIIPLACNVIIESNGATQGEVAICTTQNDVGNGTSSAGDSGPLSLNTAAPLTSAITARQLATADVTTEVNFSELRRFSYAASGVNQDFVWAARQQYVVPVLRGPASFLVYMGGNAPTFFCQMQWIELPEAATTN